MPRNPTLLEEIALQAAQISESLERTRHGSKDDDVLIASFCIENGFELIHNDHDFDPMEKILGLRVKKA